MALMHRQKTTNLHGFPVKGFIVKQDSDGVLWDVRLVDNCFNPESVLTP